MPVWMTNRENTESLIYNYAVIINLSNLRKILITMSSILDAGKEQEKEVRIFLPYWERPELFSWIGIQS